MPRHGHLNPCKSCERILDGIAQYLSEYGYPPTLRELGAGRMGASGVSYHLAALARSGRITRTPAVARGVAIAKGWE